MKYIIGSEKSDPNSIPSGSVFGVFNNHRESKEAISMILDRGYELNEIEIYPPDMGNLVPNPTPNHFPKGDEVMSESLKGLRNGAIIGLIVSGLGVGIFMLIDGEFVNTSLLFGIHTITVLGAISGAVMGFFINPHLPKPIWKFFSKSTEENKVTVNFEAHNMVDALYFSEKGGLKIAQ
ncbi:hypothetical protein M3O96_00580 [Aquiflexum sp. TKW24L]|uniref:hypothetical protein n=1 Tax=Aquiflexum sp. TKW24L TaxID=2942212 RepID=UPI0020C022EB|nr:hypothetical protein [Aquiflexum sp. TKW24L]MCL6257563.1 hypothetical protein [Aquiflexum sp. TKW24L]